MTDNYQISSNFTLFYKLFVPTVWLSFFGIFTITLFLFPKDQSFIFTNQFRYAFLLSVCLFFLLMYFTIMRLKRVEFNPNDWTATNYIKTFKYEYQDIKKIKIINLGVLKLATIHLFEKGSLGNKLPIILNDSVFNQFLQRYPNQIKAEIT